MIFVLYEKAESCNLAIQNLDGTQHGNKVMHVEQYLSKEERNKKKDQDFSQRLVIYVSNLGDNIDENVLRTMFCDCGTIVSCKVC